MSAASGSASHAGNSQVALESEQPLAWGHHYLYDLSTEHLSPFVKMCLLSERLQGPRTPGTHQRPETCSLHSNEQKGLR